MSPPWHGVPDRVLWRLLSGAALAAALVLTGVALWQTARLPRPPGTLTDALVIDRALRLPYPGAALTESLVTLLVNDPALGVFTVETPHPSARLTEIWPGGNVAIRVSAGRAVAYEPSLPRQRRRATLIALAIALALAAVFALIARLRRFR